MEWEERVFLRQEVQKEFEDYLANNVGEEELKWLKLYLQGYSPDAIANILEFPIRKVYRLREKVTYHALKVFALKKKPELVENWLKTSLGEHNFGLTPTQWDEFWQGLTPKQRQIVENVKAGKTLETLWQELNFKKSQVMNEWNKIYLLAQSIRSTGEKDKK